MTTGADARSADGSAEALADGLNAWLARRNDDVPTVRVGALHRASAGYSSRTWLVELEGVDAERDGASTNGLVVRLAPVQPVHRGDALRRQVEVQQLLASRGLPVPAPARYEAEPSWLGEPFVTMPWVAGHVAGEVPATDDWITGSSLEQRAHLYGQLTDAVGELHALDLDGVDLAWVPGQGESVSDDIERCRDYLAWATDGRPPRRLLDALDWCADERPPDPPRSLLWGDARLGNAIFDEERRLTALIDWETATVGPAELDVGYWLGLETVVDHLVGHRVEGFPARSATVARLEARLGRRLVDPEWFEVLGLLSAAAISVRLDVLRRGAPPSDDALGSHPVVARAQELIAARTRDGRSQSAR